MGTADPMENILLIRLKSIGDILFTLPAVHVIRENFPEARLHFLVSRENAPLLRGFAEIDEILPLDRAIYRSGNLLAAAASTGKLLRILRQKKFSLAIDFQGYGETELLSWWSGAPRRWGCVYNRSRGWLYTRGGWRDHHLQIADQNLSLLRQSGLRVGEIRNQYVLPPDALLAAQKVFAANHQDPAKPVLYLQPFTSSPHKNWPMENYMALAFYWRSRGVQVIFGGGPAEQAALEPARQLGFVTTAGVPLMTSAGIVRLSTVVVGGITGLLHLAVAMQKRVVMLVGYPACEPGFPYQHHDWAVTSPSGGNVSEIQTSAVIEASARAFNEQAGGGSC